MEKVFSTFAKSKNDVMEILLYLAKSIPHTKELAEMDLFIDAVEIMAYLMKANNESDVESAFWILRETGSDFCKNKEEFDKNENCNKKGYVEIRSTDTPLHPNEFFLEFYLYKND